MADRTRQLEWEARAARPAAFAAFASAAFLAASTVVGQAVARSSRGSGSDRQFLLDIDRNSGALIASAVLQALSLLALIGALAYLYRVVKARRPELPAFAGVLAVGGPLLLAVAVGLTARNRLDLAGQFVDSGVRSAARAKELLKKPDGLSTGVGSGGALALALALVLLNINAMRVGVLTRFMAIIGIVIGALYVLPVLPGLVVQLFWLPALGVLFLGHWPGGRGPAWDSGEAIPWPSGVARGEALAAAGSPGSAAAGVEAEDPPEPARPRPSRKRKKRR